MRRAARQLAGGRPAASFPAVVGAMSAAARMSRLMSHRQPSLPGAASVGVREEEAAAAAEGEWVQPPCGLDRCVLLVCAGVV